MNCPKPLPLARVTCLALLCAACQSTTTPTAGDLVIELSTPNIDDRGVQLNVQCPQPPISVTAAAGYVVYSDVGGSPVAVIVIRKGGQSIPSHADLATIRVADVNEMCTATPTSVAFQGYAVRTSLAGYSASVKP